MCVGVVSRGVRSEAPVGPCLSLVGSSAPGASFKMAGSYVGGYGGAMDEGLFVGVGGMAGRSKRKGRFDSMVLGGCDEVVQMVFMLVP